MTRKPQEPPFSLRIPPELEGGIQKSMKRLGMKKHAYIINSLWVAIRQDADIPRPEDKPEEYAIAKDGKVSAVVLPIEKYLEMKAILKELAEGDGGDDRLVIEFGVSGPVMECVLCGAINKDDCGNPDVTHKPDCLKSRAKAAGEADNMKKGK